MNVFSEPLRELEAYKILKEQLESAKDEGGGRPGDVQAILAR